MGDKINFLTAKKLFNDGLKEIYVSNLYLNSKFLHKNIKLSDDEFKIGTELNETILEKFINENVHTITISKTNSINKGPYILQTCLLYTSPSPRDS